MESVLLWVSQTELDQAAAGLFSVIILLLQRWLSLDWSSSKITNVFSPGPTQEPVEMLQSPRRDGDPQKVF